MFVLLALSTSCLGFQLDGLLNYYNINLTGLIVSNDFFIAMFIISYESSPSLFIVGFSIFVPKLE